MPFMAPVSSVLDTQGGTPVVGLQRLGTTGPRAWVGLKLESLSPTGAAQDRLAVALVEEGERTGQLPAGGHVLEAGSGGLAVSLAMVCAARGHRFTAVVPESVSEERLALLRSYGAKVELTPDALHVQGALDRADRLGKEHPDAYRPRQFQHPLTVLTYEKTLGEELVRTARADGGADALVGPIGTGGMLLGAARALRKAFPQLQTIAAHVAQAPHHIQGVDVNVTLPLVEEDRASGACALAAHVPVEEAAAVETQRALASQEGLLVGFSTGLAVHAALGRAQALGPGKRVYVLAPDSGERYFSLQRYVP